MLGIKRRLGLPALLTVAFLLTVTSLFFRSNVTTHFKQISILADELWSDDEESEVDQGVRLVVFGDSWVDNTIEPKHEGKGRSWTTILCEELKCDSVLNLARSQPALLSVASHGAMTSVRAYGNAAGPNDHSTLLSTIPDFAAQIQGYVDSPQDQNSDVETIFVISTGFWDIYELAGQDFAKSSSIVDKSVEAMFDQLTTLYSHYQYTQPQGSPLENNSVTAPMFRMIIPKVVDPSILPGWQTHRPVPTWPNNVAEEQKNAVYLATRWNLAVENGLSRWLKSTEVDPTYSKLAEPDQEVEASMLKDAFYYGLPEYILKEMTERSMQIEGLSDAHGLGKGDSPFDDVYLSCMNDDADVDASDYEEVDGKMICKTPTNFIWWDAWSLGSVANEAIAKHVARIVKTGDSMRKAWSEARKEGYA